MPRSDETGDVLTALGLVLLERMPDGAFALIGPAPDWFHRLCPGESNDIALASLPVLEGVLPEAEEFWAAHRTGRASCGVCTSTDVHGDECHFDVSAVRVGGRQVLVLRTLAGEYEERQSLYQKARERVLLFDKLERAEAALREARAVAEAATLAKSQFLANMSHEIRTPMNAVIGLSELLLSDALSRQQREFVGTIQGSAEALLTLINDILGFSKIEAGKLTLDARPFDLCQCLENACGLLGTAAASKGLDLACVLDNQLPQEIVGDSVRLRQVLINLVGNAIKFTSQGEVVVSAQVVRSAANRCDVLISVRDTGIGITPEQQGRLFQSFSQAEASTKRRFGGTGLGLAISKNLVELMGGALRVESEPNHGSVFAFTISAEVTETPPAPFRSGAHALLANKSVAIVGSGTQSLRCAQTWLTRWGIHVVESGMPCDLVIALAELGGAPPEPGLTVFKPVRPSQLHTALLEAFGQRRDRGPAAESPSPPKSLRVLLADDNEMNQTVGLRLLRHSGYEADVVSNGREVIDALRSQRYDVVLMDLQMPIMDGLDATREIHRLWAGGDRPRIIALTASAQQDDRESCLAAGMDDYLSKPMRGAELRAVLEQSARPPATVPSATAPAGFDPTILDKIRAVGPPGQPDLVQEAIDLYLSRLPESVAAIGRALKAGDAIALRSEAHGLRGSSLMLGATSIAEPCGELEQLAKDRRLSDSEAILSRLEALTEAFLRS